VLPSNSTRTGGMYRHTIVTNTGVNIKRINLDKAQAICSFDMLPWTITVYCYNLYVPPTYLYLYPTFTVAQTKLRHD